MMYEEMLASYHNVDEIIAHFNSFHNPKNGQFAKKKKNGGHMVKDYITQGTSKKKSDAA